MNFNVLSIDGRLIFYSYGKRTCHTKKKMKRMEKWNENLKNFDRKLSITRTNTQIQYNFVMFLVEYFSFCFLEKTKNNYFIVSAGHGHFAPNKFFFFTFRCAIFFIAMIYFFKLFINKKIKLIKCSLGEKKQLLIWMILLKFISWRKINGIVEEKFKTWSR